MEALANHLVELACVSGRAQPQPHCIIQLSEGPKNKAKKGEAERAEIAAELEAHMRKVNATLDAHERLDFLAIVADEWLPENGFLTPTQKIKRATIEEKYDPMTEKWYAEKKKVVFSGF